MHSTTGAVGKRKYRFGFVLTTAAGNMTRYINLRKYADRDLEVDCIWAPISHYLDPNPFRYLPGPLRNRAVVMREAQPVTSQMRDLNAVMYHAFEPYTAAVVTHRLGRRPLVVWSQDNSPVPPDDPDPTIPKYPGDLARGKMRRQMRFLFDRWCSRRTDLFVPFSDWGANLLISRCGTPRERVEAINVGLDLELWPFLPKQVDQTLSQKRLQILFVGGDFVRKGGDLLLQVWRDNFKDRADLHLVTRDSLAYPPVKGLTVYNDMPANDARLIRLYAESDVFVLPTRADVSSWVALEGMATGRPVISTRMGGIPDLVRDGETGYLIEPNDGRSLVDRIEKLAGDSRLRSEMGAAGRRVVERDFNAGVCVPRILNFLKRATDAARVGHGGN